MINDTTIFGIPNSVKNSNEDGFELEISMT